MRTVTDRAFISIQLIQYYPLLSRIATFIKTKFKKSDDQTNIDKYRIAANIAEYHLYQN